MWMRNNRLRIIWPLSIKMDHFHHFCIKLTIKTTKMMSLKTIQVHQKILTIRKNSKIIWCKELEISEGIWKIINRHGHCWRRDKMRIIIWSMYHLMRKIKKNRFVNSGSLYIHPWSRFKEPSHLSQMLPNHKHSVAENPLGPTPKRNSMSKETQFWPNKAPESSSLMWPSLPTVKLSISGHLWKRNMKKVRRANHPIYWAEAAGKVIKWSSKVWKQSNSQNPPRFSPQNNPITTK